LTEQAYREHLLPTLPDQPGIYQFLDAEGGILYVGKAKNLRNRVSSYFGERKHQLPKTRVMVKHAHRVVFTIVETEQDALLLEATLIKKHQPRYNVALKDGKTHPYIVIKNERFPRVFVTRKVLRDGATYFGPYAVAGQIHTIMELIRSLFPLRNCPLNLGQQHIDKGKYKVCLEYHIKNCQGPCAGLESEEHYHEKIQQIKNILKGNFASVTRHLRELMQRFAEELDFESAQAVKQRLLAFENYQGKSTVVNPAIHNVDVFSIDTDHEKLAFVNYLKVANGAIINTFTLELAKNLNDDPVELLAFAIPYLADKFNSALEEIVVPMPVPLPDPSVKCTVPKGGDKKKLLDLSEKNVRYYALQKRREEANYLDKQTPAERIVRTLQKDLSMEEAPIHIECFDNSNIQGAYPVAAMVCFRNAKPAKKDYRHFNIKTVEGPNDFASMSEVVHRRYARLLEEGSTLPQLIVIDGGKGQLAAAVDSLKKLGIYERVTVVGIAKRLEEIYFPDDSLPLMLSKKSESLRLLQQIRNEAHRFAITFHRAQRSRGFTRSSLTEIPGVGTKTAEKLLVAFGSLKRLKAAPPESIEALVGKSLTEKVLAWRSS
jgi:excinuclease ABC subunit C